MCFSRLVLQANFDDVLTPADHVSRSPNDTYYVDSQTVLRCHTSAHQASQMPGSCGASGITPHVQNLVATVATSRHSSHSCGDCQRHSFCTANGLFYSVPQSSHLRC